MGFLLLILPATSFLFYVGRGFPKKLLNSIYIRKTEIFQISVYQETPLILIELFEVGFLQLKCLYLKWHLVTLFSWPLSWLAFDLSLAR